jgi:type III secretory pathway component EscT
MRKNSLVLLVVAVLALFTTLPLLTLSLWEALAAYGVACAFWLGMLAPAFSSKGD